MEGDGWKWRINKTTFRLRDGKIKLWRGGKKLSVTRVHRKKTRPRRKASFFGRKWIEIGLNIISAARFFPTHDALYLYLFFLLFYLSRQSNNTEWSAATTETSIQFSYSYATYCLQPYMCTQLNMGSVGAGRSTSKGTNGKQMFWLFFQFQSQVHEAIIEGFSFNFFPQRLWV